MNTLVDGARGIGDNRPPGGLPEDTSEELRERLERDHVKLFDRYRNLQVGLARVPDAITDAQMAKEASDCIGQLNSWIGEAEDAHQAEKATFLSLGRICDEIFLRKRDVFRIERREIQHKLNIYQLDMRDRARRDQEARKRAAEEAHRKADEEAARARAEAARLVETDRPAAREMLKEVEEHEREAAIAQAVINEPEEKGQIRGDYGSLSYLKETVRYELEDPLLVPLRYMMLDDQAIRAALHKGVRNIPGLRIWTEETTVTKGR